MLGCLVEKQLTTPQQYPLTDNALIAACNQTTSRDPVVCYDLTTVRVAVRNLREQGLLRTVHRSGERSDKHQHELPAALGLSPAEVAVLAVLLLRGPQTAAELRTRTERMHPFGGVEEVEDVLRLLVEREPPLVTRVARLPGRREDRFAELLVEVPAGRSGPPVPTTPGDDAHPATEAQSPEPAVTGPPPPSVESLAREVQQLRDELAALRAEVASRHG